MIINNVYSSNYPSLLVFIRHAEMEGNIIGRNEWPSLGRPNHRFRLTDRGLEQIEKTKQWLAKSYGTKYDAEFVSTFFRTQETHRLLTFSNERPNIDSRLDEKHDGPFHTLSDADLAKYYAAEIEMKKLDGWYHFRAPGGRSGADVELSIHLFMQTLRQDFAGKRCLVVCHGNWLNIFFRIHLNLTIEEFEIYRKENVPPNCSVTIFENKYPGGFQCTLDRFVPWKTEE